MSFPAITRFFQHVARDSALESEVQTALDERGPAAAFEIVEIAGAKGYDFSATDLREYLAGEGSDVELSDEQLEAVAGGVRYLRRANLSGLRSIRKMPMSDFRALRRDYLG